METNIYNFAVKNNKGETVSLSQYRGRVLLVVNTATRCGLTPQYEALEALYQKYGAEDFEILDFPSNQFLGQAPETDEKIEEFCTLNYHTTFPRFSKIDVNGENAHPLFVWLKEQAPEDRGDEDTHAFENKVKALQAVEKDSDIKWNFGKFLIDKNGRVKARYSPAWKPAQLEEDIKELI